MHRVHLGAVIAIALVVGGSATPVGASTPPSATRQAAAAGGIGIRLVAVPKSTSNEAPGRIYIVAHVAPGAVIRRQVQVSNSTGSTAHIALYPGAAAVENGSFVGAVGHTPSDLSTWTSVRPSSSDVASRGLLTANVTISVPSTAAPGEEYGVIWAETRAAPSGDGIIQVSRVGIRIYLAVGAGGLAPANFSIGSLIADRSSVGQTTVQAIVHNTGGWPLDLSGTLRLTDGPGGLSAGALPVRLGSILAPGGSKSVVVDLNDRIPAGQWQIRLSLQGGGLDRSAKATLTLPGPTARSEWLLPVLGLIVLLLGFGSLSIGLTRRRHRLATLRAGTINGRIITV